MREDLGSKTGVSIRNVCVCRCEVMAVSSFFCAGISGVQVGEESAVPFLTPPGSRGTLTLALHGALRWNTPVQRVGVSCDGSLVKRVLEEDLKDPPESAIAEDVKFRGRKPGISWRQTCHQLRFRCAFAICIRVFQVLGKPQAFRREKMSRLGFFNTVAIPCDGT